MPKKTDAREKAVRTAARLFQLHGYHGTGLAQIIEESGCPKGSFYYHFPQGKEQLGLADDEMEALFNRTEAQSRGAPSYLRTLTRGLSQRLEVSDYCEGYLLAGLAFEAGSASARLSAACSQSYRRWNRRICEALKTFGLSAGEAASAASAIVSALSGAMLVCRAEKSSRALDELGSVLSRWLNR